MKSKFLQVRKMLLVAAGLLVGASGVWAANTKTLYPTGATDPTKENAGWVANGVKFVEQEGCISLSNGNSGSRYAYLKFYETGSDFYGSYESYTISFDVYSVNSWASSSSTSVGFTAFSEEAVVNQKNAGDAFTTGNTEKKNYLFNLHNTGTYIKTFKVNGAEEATIELGSEIWFNIKLDVTVATGEVAYTITNLSTNAVVENGTGTYIATTDGSSAKCQGLFFQVGRNAEARYINVRNVKVTTEVDEEVADDPAVVLTGINGTSRTYTISFGEGETLHYQAPGESSYSTETVSPKVITVNESGTLYAYTTRGTATSATVETIVDATELTLNAPTFSVTAYANKQYTVSLSADQKGVGLEPTATISYRIGEEGEFATYSTPVSVDEGKTIYAYASNTGYVNSTTVSYATAVRPTHYATVWTQDYTQVTSAAGDGALAVVLNAEADFTVEGTSFYNIVGYKVNEETKVCSLNTNVGLSTSTNFSLRCNGNNSGILKNGGGTGYLGIQNLKVGDVIAIATSGSFLTAANGVELNEGMNTTTEYYFTATATEVSIAVSPGTYNYIKTITVLSSSVSATIGKTGYTTFASNYALDLDELPEGVTAYYVSDVDGTSVVLEEATGVVEAGTGLILQGTANESYDIPVVASGSKIDDNKLVGCPNGKENVQGEGLYVLVNNDGTAEFQQLDEHAANIPAGKAYLDMAEAAGARTLSIVIGGETTGIAEVEKAGTENGAVYNLNGQRVSKPANGLYIVNGKKVVLK